MESVSQLRRNIYTLEQSGTNKVVQLKGKGSDLSNKKALEGRAKCKTITQSVIFKLIDTANENEEQDRVKTYWHTYHCQQKIVTDNGKIYGFYCRNRFCTLCTRIRKAVLINKYNPIIKKWEDPHFVTITVKSCKAHQLDAYFKNLQNTFRKIKEKYKKKELRGTGIKLVGIRSLESNYNPVKKTYNPHFHLIVANEEMAKIIVSEWYSRSKKGYVNLEAQNIQRIWDLEKKLLEIVKYGCKIFTEPNEKTEENTTSSYIYIKALDTIYKAMKGKRLFERFGFNNPKNDAKEPINNKASNNAKYWEFELKNNDWLNNSEEVLTNYKIPSRLSAILENNLNTELN